LDDEMVHFAGEILYNLTGCAGKNELVMDRALHKLGLPIRLLRISAFLMTVDRTIGLKVFLGIYLQMGLFLFRKLPIRTLSILASLYRTHGRGGHVFLEYERGRQKDIERRLSRRRIARAKERDIERRLLVAEDTTSELPSQK
jgi:hypothetical protein